MTSGVRIGVAGWDYADWEGVVYPPGPSSGFDRLKYLARYVDLVEVDSTFYRPVAPPVAASWVRRTENVPGFAFTAKVHRSWTHERDPDLDRVVPETLAGLAPLREADRLGALLLQFPHSFRADDRARERVRRLAERCAGWPVAIEVRHASWATDATERLFRELGVAWCAVDQPIVDPGSLPLDARVTAPFAYLRFHGRNVGTWFEPGAGRDRRYDWRYGPRAIDELAASVRRATGSARAVYAVQNNHFRGQAVADALLLRARVSGTRPVAPPGVVAAYPDLADDVTLEQERLF
jgi:uncharacterized protein YecE (DUF72 family)